MNQLNIFNHEMFGQLPVINVNDVEWFGSTEAAKSLSFGNPYDAVKNHVDDDDLAVHEVIDRLGRKQNKKFINESGLYSLIIGAAKQGNNKEIKENAKRFKRWVTGDVLPSIRKHGAYMTPETIEQALLNPDTIIKLAKNLKEEQTKRLQAEQTIELQKPKVVYADAVSVSKDTVLIKDLATVLRQKGIDIGPNRLFQWLRHNGYLCRQKGELWNAPTQRSLELGIMVTKHGLRSGSDGEMKKTRTPKITGKGQIYFINKFLNQQEVI